MVSSIVYIISRSLWWRWSLAKSKSIFYIGDDEESCPLHPSDADLKIKYICTYYKILGNVKANVH